MASFPDNQLTKFSAV